MATNMLKNIQYTFKIKGQLAVGGGILWRPPAQLVLLYAAHDFTVWRHHCLQVEEPFFAKTTAMLSSFFSQLAVLVRRPDRCDGL